MSGNGRREAKSSSRSRGKTTARQERVQRLAAALRDNLKRRKDQLRAKGPGQRRSDPTDAGE